MKSVMLSIKPKWCELIASGRKTIEVRKTRPKLEAPFKCYIYCTSVKGLNLQDYVNVHRATNGAVDDWSDKVIGEFTCDRVDTYDDDTIHAFSHEDYTRWNDHDLYQSCIHPEDFEEYAADEWLYGWHISKLVIYDEPRELSEFVVNDKMAIKTCRHRIRWGQPESVTQHGGWIKGRYFCTKYSEPVSCEPVFCENYITKPVSRPPQSWCYVEEVRK